MRLLSTFVLLSSVLLVGCTSGGSDDLEMSGVLFEVGPALSDPSVAVVVEAGEASDTLFTDRFNRNLERLNSMFPDVMSDPDQAMSIRREIVKQFVVEELITVEARRRGVDVERAQVMARLERHKRSFPTEEAYREELERFGQDESDLMDQFRIEMVRNAVSGLVEEETPEPSDADVESYSAAMAERVLTQHILFMFDETMSGEEQEAVHRRAEAVLDSALAGTNFGDLARRHSDDVGTAPAGGELPWFRRGDMVEEFEEAAFALDEPGAVTDDLVKTSYGYHIIRLVDRNRDTALDEKTARAQLKRQRVRKAERDLIERLQKDARVRVNPELIPGFGD